MLNLKFDPLSGFLHVRDQRTWMWRMCWITSPGFSSWWLPSNLSERSPVFVADVYRCTMSTTRCCRVKNMVFHTQKNGSILWGFWNPTTLAASNFRPKSSAPLQKSCPTDPLSRPSRKGLQARQRCIVCRAWIREMSMRWICWWPLGDPSPWEFLGYTGIPVQTQKQNTKLVMRHEQTSIWGININMTGL